MAMLAFSFGGATRDRLSFHFPLTFVPGAPKLRRGRYSRPGMLPPPSSWTGVALLRAWRYAAPLPRFIGEIPPQNVRANLTRAPASNGSGFDCSLRGPWRGASETAVLCRGPIQSSVPLTALHRYPFALADSQGIEQRIVIADAQGQGTARRIPLGSPAITAPAVRGSWRESLERTAAKSFSFELALLLESQRRIPWREALLLAKDFFYPCSNAITGVQRFAAERYPFGSGRLLAGVSWPWEPLPPIPPVPPRTSLRFHFHPPTPADLEFHFGREPAWAIPIQRSYRMLHSFAFVRLPDRASIPVNSVTLSSAWDEWAWTLSATLVGTTAVSLLRPVVSQAIEVELTMDGYVWQFRLDRVAGSAEFGKTGGQTYGRGRSALLGPEIALAVNGYEAEAKTARQLAEQELTGTDWQLDWPESFVDWLVPAKRFSYTAKTPMDVIVQIVETAGGHVFADPALDILHVAPRYPLPIWEWADAEPDIILPASIVKTLAWQPRIGQPWDSVYLGDGDALLAHVKRAGLPGVTMPDAPIIEALLCHLDVCRARGIALLSDAVSGVDFVLALPLSSAGGASPLRSVGELARFEDGGKTWIGIITAINISIGLDAKIVQTIEVRSIEAI